MFLALPSLTRASRNFFSLSRKTKGKLGKNRTAPRSSADTARAFRSVSYGPFQCARGRVSSMLVRHGVINKCAQIAAQLHPARRVRDHLCHEYHHHLLDRIDKESGGSHAAPGEFAGSAANADLRGVQG